MAVQAICKIGRECVQRRISAIKNGEPVPNDILTQIIKVTSEFIFFFGLKIIWNCMRKNLLLDPFEGLLFPEVVSKASKD